MVGTVAARTARWRCALLGTLERGAARARCWHALVIHYFSTPLSCMLSSFSSIEISPQTAPLGVLSVGSKKE